jgi:hypothetical protein
MIDETKERAAVSPPPVHARPETTGDVAGMSGIQVGLLLLLMFANLLVICVLWGIVSAT